MEFDKNYVKNIWNQIKENGGPSPSWFQIVSDKFPLSETIDPGWIVPTFKQLRDAGLLMEVYQHPLEDSSFILLPSLRIAFVVVKHIGNGMCTPTGETFTHTNAPIEPIELTEFDKYKLV